MSGPVFINPQTGQVNNNNQMNIVPEASGPYGRSTNLATSSTTTTAAAPPPHSDNPSIQQIFADTPLSQYVDSPLGQMATSYGQQLIGNNRFIKGSLQNYETFRQLKYYFNVNSSYVANKLRLVLLPLQHKSWKRRIHRQADGERYLAPRDDINAPDLYIPSMAFVTYVLIVAFLMGEPWHFSPEVVADQFSKSLMALVFEVAFVKAGFYFLSSASVPLLDIVAYCGYKYVGISLAVLVGFLLGSKWCYYAALALAGGGMATFVVKSFRLAAPPSAATPNNGGGSSNTRNYFLLACGIVQLVLFYFLGHFVESGGVVVGGGGASTIEEAAATVSANMI